MARDDAGRGHGAGVARLYVAMLSLQFGYAGFHVVSRLALNMGVSKLVFPVYRNLIALCLLARPRCRRGASTAAAPYVFVAVYQPVQTLLVAVMASLILGERFYLGGIIGAVLIIAGLYLVLWGKSEERALAAKEDAAAAAGTICDEAAAASCLKQPLLPPATSEAV